MPTHEGLDLHLPEMRICAFLEDEIDRFAKTVGAEQNTFVSATGAAYPVYVLKHQGRKSLGTSASWICSRWPKKLLVWLDGGLATSCFVKQRLHHRKLIHGPTAQYNMIQKLKHLDILPTFGATDYEAIPARPLVNGRS